MPEPAITTKADTLEAEDGAGRVVVTFEAGSSALMVSAEGGITASTEKGSLVMTAAGAETVKLRVSLTGLSIATGFLNETVYLGLLVIILLLGVED